MKNNLKTYPYPGNGLLNVVEAKNIWKSDFEKELRERLNRLEQIRAGGFDNHFEEGEKLILKEALGEPTGKEIANANKWRRQIMDASNKQIDLSNKLKERLDKFDLIQFVYDSNGLIINDAMEKTIKGAIFSVILDLGSLWAKEVAEAFPERETASVSGKQSSGDKANE